MGQDDSFGEPMVGVFALRTFRVSRNGYLMPVSFVGDAWAAGTCVATCNKSAHQAPDAGCTCGLYSLKDLHELRTQYPQADQLLAVVALEGTSFEGAMGWRSQAARVVAVWVAPTGKRRVPDDEVRALRANYPAVVFHRTRDDLFAAYPSLQPAAHPRRTALAEAGWRTVTAIRTGRPSRRSVCLWFAAVAALLTALLLIYPAGTSLTGRTVASLELPVVIAVTAILADTPMLLWHLLRHGGRVAPAWLGYRPARYLWWMASAALVAGSAATQILGGTARPVLIAITVGVLLVLRLTEVFLLNLPRQMKTRPSLLARMGVRKLPPRTGVVATTKNASHGSGEGLGRLLRAPGWFNRLIMHSVIVDYDVIAPPPPTGQDN